MLSTHSIPMVMAAINFHRIADNFRMPFQDHYFLWKCIGFAGMFIFGSRTFVQWIYSERLRESKVPTLYWWLSIVGTFVCLAYALRQKDSVFILMYTFNMIPYVRNVMLIRKKSLKSKEQLQSFSADDATPGTETPAAA
jgi:lipid-A-disaccharide synthase-like uncharacterized protein